MLKSYNIVIPRLDRGMTAKGIIQRSYKMMLIVKPRLLRRGEFTKEFTVKGNKIVYSFPAHSFTQIKIKIDR